MIGREVFEEIARKFGTPVYVYEEKVMRRQVKSLIRSIGYEPRKIFYAIKANSNPHILKILREEGVGIDAVSPGEIALALRAGFPPWKILFTGNNITDEEMDFAEEKGVILNIESLPRLEKFGKKYPGRTINVRINPDVGAGHHDHCITGGPESKFGIWYSETAEIKRIADNYGLEIMGIHQHIGSQILEVEKFLTAMEVLLRVALNFPDLRLVDFGGGLGVPYRPEESPLDIKKLGQKMSDYFGDFCKKYGRPLTLVIEPGRYLVAEAGYLLTRVNTVKRNPDGRVFVGVESGFNHLIRPAMYGSYHPIFNISNLDGEKEKVDVVGNLCESGDKFAVGREINRAREGHLISIEVAGAYGFSMSSNYNLRPKPAEVLVKANGNLQLIRKRETIEKIIGGI
jgi:diaminopimelate decarboxylase